MTEQRLCRDCVWCLSVFHGATYHCTQPAVEATVARWQTNSAVTGQSQEERGLRHTCDAMRASGALCGPNGMLWQRREGWAEWMVRSLSHALRKTKR